MISEQHKIIQRQKQCCEEQAKIIEEQQRQLEKMSELLKEEKIALKEDLGTNKLREEIEEQRKCLVKLQMDIDGLKHTKLDPDHIKSPPPESFHQVSMSKLLKEE